MSNDNAALTLTQTIEKLSSADSLKGLFHQHRDGNPIPSGAALEEIIQLLRAILFPGYYGKSSINTKTLTYHIGVSVERLHKLLAGQILAGLCFNLCEDCTEEDNISELSRLSLKANELSSEIIRRLPQIRSVLATDVTAAGENRTRPVSAFWCC